MSLLRSTRTAVAVLAAAVLLIPGAALAAGDDVPTIDVAPGTVTPGGPNGGRWFFQELAPGRSARSSAVLTNIASVPQTVSLYTRDLRFGPDGTPDVVDATPTDAGAWLTLDRSTLTLAPGQRGEVGFTVDVPARAEPGDHTAVVVVESAAVRQDGLRVVKRVATRLYVTVPGEATRSFDLKARTSLVGGLFIRGVDVDVAVRNTGRIRLRPEVSIAGRPASGSDVVLSESVETYSAEVPVPWYGGRVAIDVRADAGSGLARNASESRFIIPWALIALVLVTGLSVTVLGLAARQRRHRRQQEVAQLQEQVRRLEAGAEAQPS